MDGNTALDEIEAWIDEVVDNNDGTEFVVEDHFDSIVVYTEED